MSTSRWRHDQRPATRSTTSWYPTPRRQRASAPLTATPRTLSGPELAFATMPAAAASSVCLRAGPAPLRGRRVRAATSAARFDRRSAVGLLLLSAAAAPPANAASIGLFGIRKKLERAEEAAAEAVRDVEEAAAEAVQEVEEAAGEAVKGTVEAAEKEVEGVAGGLQLAAAGDGLVQAAAVAGAEALGVVVGLSVVNGILGSEA